MRNIFVLMLFTALIGCKSTLPVGEDVSTLNTSDLSSFNSQHHRLIASNLVNALTQLDGLYPSVTTLQIPDAKTPFGLTLLKAITEAGYGLQSVEGDLGANLLRFRAENSESELGFRTVYRVDIGDQFVEREYSVTSGNVLPTSPMRVSGTNDNLILNDAEFGQLDGSNESSYVVAKSEAVPEIKLLTANSAIPEFNVINAPQPQEVVSFVDNFERRKRIQNIYNGNPSEYAELFSDYEGITKNVLVFPNDSLRLGKQNKRIIQSLAESFDPEYEVFLVLGCSQGKTDLDEGNQYLAVGRADRVKDELLANGIDSKKIFDEGCWGGSHQAKDLPSRGVVLSRKRRSAG